MFYFKCTDSIKRAYQKISRQKRLETLFLTQPWISQNPLYKKEKKKQATTMIESLVKSLVFNAFYRQIDVRAEFHIIIL